MRNLTNLINSMGRIIGKEHPLWMINESELNRYNTGRVSNDTIKRVEDQESFRGKRFNAFNFTEYGIEQCIYHYSMIVGTWTEPLTEFNSTPFSNLVPITYYIREHIKRKIELDASEVAIASEIKEEKYLKSVIQKCCFDADPDRLQMDILTAKESGDMERIREAYQRAYEINYYTNYYRELTLKNGKTIIIVSEHKEDLDVL